MVFGAQRFEITFAVERLASKIAVGRITPREMIQLKVALSCISPLKEQCKKTNSDVLQRQTEKLDACRTNFSVIILIMLSFKTFFDAKVP